jgi:hypothetical protein
MFDEQASCSVAKEVTDFNIITAFCEGRSAETTFEQRDVLEGE